MKNMGGVRRTKHFLGMHKLLFLILIPVIALIGWLIFNAQKPEPLETVTVKSTNITEALSATGSINSLDIVNLSFLGPGKLVYLSAKKGDMVKKGQTIAVLDQRSMQKNIEQSLRDYSKQRNKFEQTKDDNEDIPLEDEIKRILDDNQHDLNKAVASVELQTLAKEQSVLSTPIAGVVTRSDVSKAGVNVSLTTTWTIADTDELVFEMEIDEADIGKVSVGQSVNISFDAYPDQQIQGQISTIDYASHDNATGGNVFTAQATLDPAAGVDYRIGMNGDAEVVLHEKTAVTTVPLASILDDEYVFVQTKEGFEKRKITPGIQSDTDVEITSGLREGEVIALDPVKAEESIKTKKKYIFF